MISSEPANPAPAVAALNELHFVTLSYSILVIADYANPAKSMTAIALYIIDFGEHHRC